LYTAKTLDLVWIWLGGDYGNVFLNGFYLDSVVNMCKNYLHGSDSEQRTHEFIHIYPASASVLQFCDYHNMVAILEKNEYNVDFHPIVDFIEASPLRYALTFKPTIYVSHIRQFWSTARIETAAEGTQILATMDGVLRTVTESSLRRNLKLQDEEGISSLLDTELFKNLTLMGYNISPNQKFTFQKEKLFTTLRVNSPSFSGRIVPLFDSMLIQQCEGSETPTEPHHTPSQEAQPSSPTHISTSSIPTVISIPTVTQSEPTPLRQYTRRARIAQSSKGRLALLTLAL
nr:hypothetical protein [Tanacetum cinerariifolium]